MGKKYFMCMLRMIWEPTLEIHRVGRPCGAVGGQFYGAALHKSTGGHDDVAEMCIRDSTEVTETVKAAKKLVDLIGAEFLVSVGRGISKDVEGVIKLAEELAEVPVSYTHLSLAMAASME